MTEMFPMIASDSKPKVGILTFHNGPNYGGFMQAWHLRTAIRNMGFAATDINYLHPCHLASNQKKIPVRDLGSLKARIHWALKQYPFRNLGNQLCDHPFTTDPQRIDWRAYHRIVVGSDVVWDFETANYGHDPAYFGALPSQRDSRFVSYAASCGPADVNGPLPDYCNALSTFEALSVRDDGAARLVRRITGNPPQIVVDPTWLQDDPQDDFFRRIGRKYILVYGATLEGGFARAVAEMCRTRGWAIISAAAGCAVADKTYRMLTPFQWVSMLSNAQATIIGGLHGTLYSIKYRKPFVLIADHNTRQKARQVLEASGQLFRQVEPGQLTRDHIELLAPDSRLPAGVPTDWRNRSLDFLANSLND
jgi:hypothetical protein